MRFLTWQDKSISQSNTGAIIKIDICFITLIFCFVLSLNFSLVKTETKPLYMQDNYSISRLHSKVLTFSFLFVNKAYINQGFVILLRIFQNGTLLYSKYLLLFIQISVEHFWKKNRKMLKTHLSNY